MRKTFEFGKVDGYGNSRKDCLVTVEMELSETSENIRFSVRGNVWNRGRTDVIMSGQCLDELKLYPSLRNNRTFCLIYDLWKKYHLNDMRAGTEDQEIALKCAEIKGVLGKRYDYTEACEYLKSIGLYEVEYEGKPYKYGTGWLYHGIPEEDMRKIRDLFDGTVIITSGDSPSSH